MKLTITFFAFVFSLSALTAAADVSPQDFAGQYKLVKSVAGLLCDPTINGSVSGSMEKGQAWHLNLGLWSFPNVGGGRVHFEDTLASGWSETTVSGMKVIFRSERFLNAIAQTTKQRAEARLNGRGLHIRSKARSSTPNGFETEIYFECIYKKVEN